MHIGRSFSGSHIEDSCPCPKAPCGLVVQGQYDPSCEHHPYERMKTMRQGHRDEDCRGPESVKTAGVALR